MCRKVGLAKVKDTMRDLLHRVELDKMREAEGMGKLGAQSFHMMLGVLPQRQESA